VTFETATNSMRSSGNTIHKLSYILPQRSKLASRFEIQADIYDNNVSGTITLLRAAQAAGINKIVFSSTCATYGIPSSIPMNETHSQTPINPYGRSKLIVEQILKDLDLYQGFRSFILRYFNAAGADPEGRIGEWHTPETHAIPIAFETTLGRRPHFQVLGTDYDTRDGSYVRDFVHVLDLADAHSRAVEHLLGNGPSQALNLGTGHGTSVKELLEAVSKCGSAKL
jgi:UDP-glucose 4-epimerase